VQNRMLRAAAALAAIGFVAACEAPTPTVSDGVAADVAAPAPDTPKQAPVAERESRQIVVEAGQSLSRIAAKYSVPQRAIIAANDLAPPYKIKTGQQLLLPSADGPPPAPAVAGSPQPEVISVGRPAVAESTALSPAAGPAADVPAATPVEVAASAGDKRPEPLRAAAVPVPAVTGTPPAPPGPAEPPAPATTAAASAPLSAPAAAPPGVTCPSGTTGMWSEDIIKLPVYICRKPQSPS
jgi:LysM repeat protein